MSETTVDDKIPICFLHGLDSSPEGTKASLIRENYPDSIIPRLAPGLRERLETAEKAINRPALLAGTSMGGLTAIQYAMDHADMVKGLLLMAPVGDTDMPFMSEGEKNDYGSSVYVPEGIPTVIIGGKFDNVVPASSIKALIKRSPHGEDIIFHEVEDDHDLHNHLHLMMEELDKMLGRIQGFPPPF